MHLLAATTADDVFKSMGSSINDGGDMNPWTIVTVIGGIVALVVVVVLVNRIMQRKETPQANGSATKLNRQLVKAVGLKSREMKQLKVLAAQEEIDNPLVLLLCPSVLKSAAAKRQTSRAA